MHKAYTSNPLSEEYSLRRSERCATPVDAEGPTIRWEMQETLWKSFLKKRVKPMLLAKQESCRQKSICWNCSKPNLRNKSLKNQRSSIDFQDSSAKRGSERNSPK